jgi:large subunit ribosomal protein L13
MKDTTKTFLPRDPGADRSWVLVDAKDKPLGRLATKIADTLRGKNKATFTPHIDTGDFVIVVNAAQVKLTGNKNEQKKYARYSGYRSGLKETTAAAMRERHPDRLIKLAVKGMLPKNKLCDGMASRLKVYSGEDHPHAAQKPTKRDLVQVYGKSVSNS